MEQKKVTLYIKEYLLEELNNTDLMLVEAARDTAADAWAPYSSFRVGAALLLDNGEIIRANNQENAAYPSGLCAERVAVFYANANYPDIAIRALAITAIKKGDFMEEPVYPCGACRQVLIESENRHGKPMRILMAGKNRVDIVDSASALLPRNFNYKDLA